MASESKKKERTVSFFQLNVDNPEALHPVYKELLLYPPKGFSFIERESLARRSYHKSSSKKPWYGLAVPLLRWMKNVIGLPIIVRVRRDADLIHSGQALLSTAQPWVIDFEIITSLAGFDPDVTRSPTFRRVLKRYLEAENCKAILPWSEAAKKSLFTILDTPAIRKKTHVVSPAVSTEDADKARRTAKTGKKAKRKGVTFLFVSRFFSRKGGHEALAAFKKVHDKHPDSNLIIVGDIPSEVRSSTPSGVTFFGAMSREKVYREIFAMGDVFLYPTFYDTFGLVILEAMAFGMPCITLDDFATAELVEDGKDGFVIKGYEFRQIGKDGIHIKKYQDPGLLMELNTEERGRAVKQIAEKMELLIDDPGLRDRMGKAAKRKMETGSYSITARNRRLGKIYSEAVR